MKKTILITGIVLTALASSAQARDQIRIVGSSTVFPFATAVAEQFGRSGGFKTPVVESTGTGGGFKLFCAGVGEDTADMTGASRAIKQSEIDDCAKNNVNEITEIKIGYDGIVIANAKTGPKFTLTVKELYLALARQVPDGKGGFGENPYKNWRDINPALPDEPIRVYGPPPTSGTRDAFVELAMVGGCNEFAEVKALAGGGDEQKATHKQMCETIREDGAYIEAGENDNLIVQKLEADRTSVGIFGFSFLDANADKVQGAVIGNVAPEFETIAAGDYKLSRPLFIYVKKAHVDSVPGIREFLQELTSDEAWGDEGYLSDRGLIPLPADEREAVAKAAIDLPNVTR